MFYVVLQLTRHLSRTNNSWLFAPSSPILANYYLPLNGALCISLMRKLNLTEIEIITKLLDIAKLQIDITQLLVNPVDDGGMGSLSIGENYDNRQLGEQVAEYMFKDLDGTPVSAALNVDESGELYELDIWKVDFSLTQMLK